MLPPVAQLAAAAVSAPAASAAAERAQESSGVLLRSFVIALVVMAPVALWQWWRIRNKRERDRAGAERTTADLVALSETGAGAEPVGSGGPAEDPRSLESLVANVGQLASRLDVSQKTVIDVPPGLTVGGRPSDPRVVEAVLRDAIERSGLALVSTESDGEILRLHCRRR